MSLEPLEMLLTLLVGLVAGAVGGLAGIGGSIIMLPALGLLLGYGSAEATEQHLYIGAAMCVNVVVAYFSRGRHRQAGAVRPDIVRPLLYTMCTFVLAGVLLATPLPGTWPKFALIVFIFGYAGYNVAANIWKLPEAPDDAPRPALWKLLAIGGVTGTAAGFLGIGGGIVMVPLLQAARVPLRQAIAASASVMWVSAMIGATAKLATLYRFDFGPLDALVLAGPMALGAVFGARAGAALTHKLRLPWLRTVIAIVLAMAAARLAVSALADARGDAPAETASPAAPPSEP